MVGALCFPAQSSKEETRARRETCGLLIRETVLEKIKVLLMKSRGLGGEGENLSFVGCRWSRNGALLSWSTTIGLVGI